MRLVSSAQIGLTGAAMTSSPSSWLDRARAVRDRWIANPRFRNLAASFPLSRPIARRRARAIFDLCAGFVYSQVLSACVRLHLFDVLAEGPQSTAQVAERLSLSTEAAARLLAAAVSLELVSQRGKDRFALGPLGAPLVDNPALDAMIEHHALLYADLADPVALLRGQASQTALSNYWSYSRAGQPDKVAVESVADYSTLMSASQPLVAAEILDAFRLGRHRCLLDVGGGEGRFLLAAAERHPNLQVMLFDLPAVAARARERFADAGLGPRATAIGGNFLADPLPSGADVISLVRVVHDHDDAAVLALLRAARRALPDGGTLLLAEPMADTAGAESMGGAYFGFYLLAMGQGRPRTREELFSMLRAAGFTNMRAVRTRMPLQTGLIVARP
jgi:demethylspheroidene O-methyltransferase